MVPPAFTAGFYWKASLLAQSQGGLYNALTGVPGSLTIAWQPVCLLSLREHLAETPAGGGDITPRAGCLAPSGSSLYRLGVTLLRAGDYELISPIIPEEKTVSSRVWMTSIFKEKRQSGVVSGLTQRTEETYAALVSTLKSMTTNW